jgi:hypothetical protein
MALATWEEGTYVACMAKELGLPTDLAACHAMIRDQARAAAARERASQVVIKRQHDKIEEQRIEIAKLEAEPGRRPAVRLPQEDRAVSA